MPPLVTAITGLISAISTFAASSWLAGFAVRVVLAIGFSALARALTPKPKPPGITTATTQTGGTDPQAFILGRYATGGQLVAPPMTHGAVGKTPNAYLTYVIAVSDVPGATLSRILIDGEVATIGGPAHPDYGLPVTLKGTTGSAWVKWYDGTQTVADPMLIAKYGAHPERPWTADMVGTGTAYAIMTFRFNRQLFKSFPTVRVEVDGIRLYDPRQDPAMGGTGSQSWASPATWTQTDNPAVMIYNILRGLAIPGGDTWGGGWDATDLPTPEWFAAMNACDAPIALSAGGSEPAYRAGYEVAVDDEPADVIEELLKTCAGRMADVGGLMKIAVGAPGLPVKAITDADIIVTDEQSAALFPSLAQTHNGVHATFPDPASLWESRDAPPRYDALAEAEDGRRLIATVALPACPYAGQVQRLMQAWVNEERRFRRHQFVLPPDATILEPHDVVSYTSARNGYSGKLFEVVEIAHDPVSLLQLVSLREVDPGDYDWDTTLELPWVAPVPGTSLPPAQTVPAFAVTGTALDDAASVARRPALLLTWDGADQDDVTALEYELRLLGGVQVVTGATLSVAASALIVTAGILPATNYEVRARFIAPRPVAWTAWKTATTPAAYIAPADFGTQIDTWFAAAGISVPRFVASLPPNDGSRIDNEWVYLIPAKKLYRWSAAAGDWISIIDPADIPDGDILGQKIAVGTLIAGLFAAGAIKAGDMEIDGNLRLDAAGAGFSIGKDDAADTVHTGLYMGRRIAPGGGIGFGFLLGTTSLSGVARSLSASDDQGVSAVNMTFGLLTDLAPAATSYTASQTLALGAATQTITMTLLGGGGGSTSAGGQTKVELYEAGAPTGIEWTSNGGLANASSTINGQNSVLGTGGLGVSGHWQGGSQNGYWVPTAGTNATGYGAGGGGRTDPDYSQTKGGGAAQPTYVMAFDVSGYASPSLVITIGAKGTGVTQPSPGIVKLQQVSTQVVPAGVIPFAPTATGTFTKGASATGAAIFPDLGGQKGLWVINNNAGSGVLGMSIRIDSVGTTHDVTGFGSFTFVSDIRPEVMTSDSTSRTIQYAFYRMSVED